jgi:dienelactone hydrolase
MSSVGGTRARAIAWGLAAVVSVAPSALRDASAQLLEKVSIRGTPQTLRVYGREADPPVVVSSGDGGWMHLGPEVAEWLAAQGYFVVGVDSKAYLAGFTSGTRTLTTTDVPGDYRVFVDAARRGRERRVLLVGVSLGAGLSVLAASSAHLHPFLGGVIALGLPDENELGWRFRDSIIYFTKKTPNEPTFHAADVIPAVSPIPLAGIHSAHDEFAPVSDARRLFALPGAPKRLWVVEARNHRFSGNREGYRAALAEALAWITKRPPGGPDL